MRSCSRSRALNASTMLPGILGVPSYTAPTSVVVHTRRRSLMTSRVEVLLLGARRGRLQDQSARIFISIIWPAHVDRLTACVQTGSPRWSGVQWNSVAPRGDRARTPHEELLQSRRTSHIIAHPSQWRRGSSKRAPFDQAHWKRVGTW